MRYCPAAQLVQLVAAPLQVAQPASQRSHSPCANWLESHAMVGGVAKPPGWPVKTKSALSYEARRISAWLMDVVCV